MVLAYGVAGTYLLGPGGNFNVKISGLSEALYFTIVTISTVGYGDIVPVTNLGRIFVEVLIIAGLSIFLSAVTVLSSDILGARMERIYNGISVTEKRKMKNHIILIGYDAANAQLAEMLREEKKNFIIITADKTVSDSLRGRGYSAYVADYTMRADMEKFEIPKASNVVIDLRDSSKTIYVVLVVRKLSAKVKLSVVVQDSETEAHLSDLQIDHIINPVSIAAEMANRVINSGSSGKG